MKPDILGWLVLAVSGFRSYQVSGRKFLLYVLIWVSIFGVVGFVFYSMSA